MKNRTFTGLTAAVFYAVAAITMGACSGGSNADLESPEGRGSYAIGVNFGTGIRNDNVPLDMDAFLLGIADAMEDRELRMSDEEIGQALQELTTRVREEQQRRARELTQQNLEEGQAYLTENGQRSGVTTTASGLQYEVITQGSGPRPSATDRVSVHYRGTLIDGTEFDTSYDSDQPATFPVNGVISGWVEALQLMPVGSKWRLVIPSNLAYGERGSGRHIGPNATLPTRLPGRGDS